MSKSSLDSFDCCRSLSLNGRAISYYSLSVFAQASGIDVSRLPFAFKILLENLLRHEDGIAVTRNDIEAIASWDPESPPTAEIAMHPARVVLQDFTGVPAVVDLAAMRDAVTALGGDPSRINPLFPSELVIDHSIQVDFSGASNSLSLNVDREYGRNGERYGLLRWAQQAFENFKVIPPATGIVHQVNLEHLARVVFERDGLAFFDTLVGTDSHTTMVNGLGVLGWGVGGIEAEAAMLGQPLNLLAPQVLGIRLDGTLNSGVTATDVVLSITKVLRDEGVVGKFVEFFGPGLECLSLADRATIANMSPEFGSTCALFPIDEKTLEYLRMTGRDATQVALVEAYARAQGVFASADGTEVRYSKVISVELSEIVPTLAGPRRPHDRVLLRDVKQSWIKTLPELVKGGKAGDKSLSDLAATVEVTLNGNQETLAHGSIVIAAITSCTNTSNPSVMLGAGLLAKKAVERGLVAKPWVKTSLAPGSRVVTRYLEKAGLLEPLQSLGFFVVGYGCTTCIGNSGPLPETISKAIADANLVAVSVLSGNRNFEGRISPDVRANYLASPPLVVAYSLVGHIDIDFETESLGVDSKGQRVFLRDIWPTSEEIQDLLNKCVTAQEYNAEYGKEILGDDRWRSLPVPNGTQFKWDPTSTYVRKPTFFESLTKQPGPLADIRAARILALLGDFVTTDHISPAGNIAKNSAAAQYLSENGVAPSEYNSYGARRGNHEVMMRGTFANVRLKNRLVPDSEGPFTIHADSGEKLSIFDAAMRYQKNLTPLIVVAGKEYGSGSSRDWAAKGTYMLGIRAVIAESFERIHRSNLIGMGVLPLEFVDGNNQESLGLCGHDSINILGIAEGLSPRKLLNVEVVEPNGHVRNFAVRVRIDTLVELEYYRNGGILNYVLRQLVFGAN
jgi:aconitate hydratase